MSYEPAVRALCTCCNRLLSVNCDLCPWALWTVTCCPCTMHLLHPPAVSELWPVVCELCELSPTVRELSTYCLWTVTCCPWAMHMLSVSCAPAVTTCCLWTVTCFHELCTCCLRAVHQLSELSTCSLWVIHLLFMSYATCCSWAMHLLTVKSPWLSPAVWATHELSVAVSWNLHCCILHCGHLSHWLAKSWLVYRATISTVALTKVASVVILASLCLTFQMGSFMGGGGGGGGGVCWVT